MGKSTSCSEDKVSQKDSFLTKNNLLVGVAACAGGLLAYNNLSTTSTGSEKKEQPTSQPTGQPTQKPTGHSDGNPAMAPSRDGDSILSWISILGVGLAAAFCGKIRGTYN